MARRAGNSRVFSPFPLFHMAGIMWCLPIITFIDSTIVLGPTAPLSVDLVHDVHTFGAIDYTSLPPSVLTELCKRDAFIERTKKLQGLTYAGGPLAEATGDMLCQHVPLYTDYGSTEMGAPPLLPPDRQHWQYFKFNEEQSGFEFRPAENGLYELVIVRKIELDLTQAIFVTFPDLQEYHTKDLFVKHSTEPHLWKYASRQDDIIVYSSGEKMNPVSMEGTITACPHVTGCLVVGAGRSESALLVEAETPPVSDDERLALVEEIWPHVQRANASAVAHGRIAKDRIFFTTAEKPLLRAGKGTVQRQRSVTMYQREIEEVYDDASDKARKSGRLTTLDLRSHSTTVASLSNYVAGKVGLERLEPDTDFFRAGMDSVQVIELARTVNASLDKTKTIEPKQVYDNPASEQLAGVIAADAPAHAYDEDSDDDVHLETWTQMQQIYHDFTADFPEPASGALRKHMVPFGGVQSMKSGGRRRTFKKPSAAAIEEYNPKPVDGGISYQSEKHSGSQDTEYRYLASSDEQFLTSMLPPDGGKTAWLQVLASFLINLNMWGLVDSFGVYQAYYQQTLLKDKSSTAIACIGSIQAALLLIVGVFSGPLFDKGYFRSIVLIAGLGLVFAIMMLSLATDYYQILLCQGVLLGLCSGLLYIPSLALIPLYFKDNRGLAFGLALAGTSIGGIIYPIVFRRLLDSVGFGWATRIIGFIAFTTLGGALIIAKPLPLMEKPSRDFLELSAMKELPFLAFMMTAFLTFCAFLVPFFFTPTFAITALGTSDSTAFYLIAVINAAQLFGQVIPAWLSDHIGGEAMLGAAILLDAVLGFCWISANSMGRFVAFLIFYGFSSGMIVTLPPIVMPYVCPSLAVLGTRLGMVYASAGLGALIGAPVAISAASSTGGFLGAQLWVGSCAFVASVLFSVTGVAAWRQRQANDSKRHRVVSPAFMEDSGAVVGG